MNIISIVPGPIELRKYLEEIMHDNHGFAEEIRSYVMQNYFSDVDSVYEIDISILSNQNVLETLEIFNQVPQELFFIADKNGNKLTDRYDLTNLIEMQCNEQGGLAIFQSFNLQIYFLYNERGESLIGACNDLSLGLEFTVESRGSRDWALWEYYCYKNNELVHINSGDFISSLDYFPYSLVVDHLLKNASDFDKDNNDYVTQAIIDAPISVIYASKRLQNDKVFLKRVLSKSEKSSRNIFPYLSIELREDPEIYSLVGITENDFEKTVFNSDDYSKMKNEKLLLKILENNSSLLQYFPEKFKSSKDVVLNAVKKSGFALEFASDELKRDKDVVISAINNQGSSLGFASDELKRDKDVVISAVKNSGYALRFASDELKADKEVVILAVEKEGSMLKYASDKLKADKEVVILAVKKNGSMLEYASDELKTDKDVVLVSVKNYSSSLQYASNELKSDKDVVIAAITKDGGALKYASLDLRNNKEIYELALSSGPSNFDYKIGGDLIIQDKEYIAKILESYPWADLSDIDDLPF